MSEKLTFTEFISQLSESTGNTQQFSTEFIRELVSVIEEGLKASGTVRLSGFGKFELRWMNERKGRNPQTGDEITIPAQNKIVFSPYKSLSERVNKPFEGKEPVVLSQQEPGREDIYKPDTEELSRKPLDKKKRKESTRAGSLLNSIGDEETDESENDNDLLIERPHPGKTKPETAERSAKPEEAVPVPVFEPFEPKMPETKPSKRKLTFYTTRYTYLYLVILAIVLIFAIYYLASRSARQTAVIAPPEAEPPAVEQPAPDTVSDQQVEDEPAEESDNARQQNTEIVTVEEGQSLWAIAESRLGNPYLWPLIYSRNTDKLDNPNQIIAGADLTIPGIDDPQNLSRELLDSVAESYILVYQWVRNENPGQAKFFLWAAGVFSMQVVLDSAGEVAPEDLEFAKRR